MPDTLARLVELVRRMRAVLADLFEMVRMLLPGAPMLACAGVYYLRRHGRPYRYEPPRQARTSRAHVRRRRVGQVR